MLLELSGNEEARAVLSL